MGSYQEIHTEINIIDILLLADEIIDCSISDSCSGFVSDINSDDQITILDILLLTGVILLFFRVNKLMLL